MFAGVSSSWFGPSSIFIRGHNDEESYNISQLLKDMSNMHPWGSMLIRYQFVMFTIVRMIVKRLYRNIGSEIVTSVNQFVCPL